MIAEVILTTESLAANVARVGPLIRVCPLVDEEIVGFGELTVAELADKLLLGSGCAARTTEESGIVLTRVERRDGISRPQPWAHKERNSVLVLKAESCLLGSSITLLLLS